MSKLELKVPPVAVFIIVLALSVQSALLFPDASYLPLPLNGEVLVACIGLSALLGVSALYQFRQARTSVNPVKIHKVSALVVKGIFNYTRNPMYLSLLVFLFGIAYWLESWASMLWCLGFILYMNRFQIIPEERLLTERYGEQYLKYQQRVKRWLL